MNNRKRWVQHLCVLVQMLWDREIVLPQSARQALWQAIKRGDSFRATALIGFLTVEYGWLFLCGMLAGYFLSVLVSFLMRSY